MGHLSNHTQINAFNNILTINQDISVIRDGKFLFRMGDVLDGIYRVNSGSIKLFRSNEAGEEQVIGFYMAGDLVGLDALSDGMSHSTAIVLETANVSLITFESLLNKNTQLDYHSIIMQIGVSFNRENDRTMMLTNCTVDRRLAWFFLNFSDDLSKRGYCGNEFNLPMKRKDIALYLAIAAGTLSRIFTSFCEKGLIKVSLRRIEILDIGQLRKIACGDARYDFNSPSNEPIKCVL